MLILSRFVLIFLKLTDRYCLVSVKAKSDKGRRTVAFNKYPHHLGSGGYEGKSAEWRKVLDANKDSDSPVVRIQNPRGKDWVMGRAEVTADGRIVLPTELQSVAQRMVRVIYNSESTSIVLLL